MWRKVFDKQGVKISIISCGDTGQEIGAGIISTLKKYGVNSKSLAIASEIEKHHRSKLFNERVIIDDQNDGFAKKIDESLIAAKNKTEEITIALRKIIEKSKNSLLLLTTGPGATGLGSTLVVLEILAKEFNKIPPILTLLPEVFENSRVQYNAAKFLFEVAYKADIRGNALILLDNKPTLSEMDIPFSQLSKGRLETIPSSIGDLLISALETSISEEFSADVSDLFEVMHTPGISVFVSEDLGSETGMVDSSRIEDVISDSVIDTTSLTKDKVFEARNAFVAIFNIGQKSKKLSLQTEFETRKLFREFVDINPFVKFVHPELEEEQSRRPKLRAIIAGLPVPPRTIQVMQLAREARKRIIIQEQQLEKEIIPLNLEKISKLEDNLDNIFSK